MNQIFTIMLIILFSSNVFAEWPPENKKLFYSICVKTEIQDNSYEDTANFCKCMTDEISRSTDVDAYTEGTKLNPKYVTLTNKIGAYCRKRSYE